jgi:hypothetical protein
LHYCAISYCCLTECVTDLGGSADFGGQSHDESMTTEDDMKKLHDIDARLEELKNAEEDPYAADFAG